MLIAANDPGVVRLDVWSICWGPNDELGRVTQDRVDQRVMSQRDLAKAYRSGQRPGWPSDHPLVNAVLHYAPPGLPGASIGLASWNVMTQGAARPSMPRWDLAAVRAQGEQVVSVLAGVFAPGSGVDVLCLQEAGGGQGREGSRGPWHEVFCPRALTAAIRGRGEEGAWERRFRVQTLEGKEGPPAPAPEAWAMARHCRRDARRGQGIGAITLVRTTALDYERLVLGELTREEEFGEAGHACMLPLIWSGGHRVRTHITNVHALPSDGRRTKRPFFASDALRSLGLEVHA